MKLWWSPAGSRAIDEQGWLLQAAFLPDHRAVQAWEQWRNGVNLDGHLPEGPYRLLPTLYRNLRPLGVSDSFLTKMRGVGRQNWLKNRLAFRTLAEPMRELSARGIELMALYGTALALRYSPDYFLSPAGYFAFLVRDEQAAAAMIELQSSGWAPIPELPVTSLAPLVATRHDYRFQDAEGNEIQLYWRLPPASYQLGLEEEVWGRAVVTHVDDVPIHTLDPADQILHLCLPHNRSSFTRAIDVMLVLAEGGGEIDWDRMITLARDHRLCQPLKETLGYLQDNLETAIPATAWQRLRALRVSRWERLEHRYRVKRPAFWGKVPELWFDHRRRSGEEQWLSTVVGFARLLQRNWGLRYVWQVPFWAVVRGLRKMSQVL